MRDAVIAIVLLIAGALGAGAYYRTGPLEDAQRRLVAADARTARAQTAVAERDGRIAVLEQRLTQETRSHTRTQANLDTTTRRATDAQDTIGQQNRILLEQERDIYVLRTCLRGIAGALDAIRAGNRSGAVGAIQGVERECRAAGRLIYP